MLRMLICLWIQVKVFYMTFGTNRLITITQFLNLVIQLITQFQVELNQRIINLIQRQKHFLSSLKHFLRIQLTLEIDKQVVMVKQVVIQTYNQSFGNILNQIILLEYQTINTPTKNLLIMLMVLVLIGQS